jgi:N-acetylglucosaminyl-diphospho-decaprenol L-rhamnosyltransferase
MEDGLGATPSAVPGISVVIVNYRTAELTRRAVDSVLEEPAVQNVVVVDNDSRDGSYESLQAQFATPLVTVVKTSENVGFGRGINFGVQYCLTPLLFFLNSDAVLTPGSLAVLARVMVRDPSIGVVAPAIYQANGTLQGDSYGLLPKARGLRFRTPIPYAQRLSCSRSPDWVTGAAMMVRRDHFLSLGGFDARFLMYLEDVDLCRRILEQGKTVVREPSASVVHLRGRSSDSDVKPIELFHTSKSVYLDKVGASRFQHRYAHLVRSVRIRQAHIRRRLVVGHRATEAPDGQLRQ